MPDIELAKAAKAIVKHVKDEEGELSPKELAQLVAKYQREHNGELPYAEGRKWYHPVYRLDVDKVKQANIFSKKEPRSEASRLPGEVGGAVLGGGAGLAGVAGLESGVVPAWLLKLFNRVPYSKVTLPATGLVAGGVLGRYLTRDKSASFLDKLETEIHNRRHPESKLQRELELAGPETGAGLLGFGIAGGLTSDAVDAADVLRGKTPIRPQWKDFHDTFGHIRDIFNGNKSGLKKHKASDKAYRLGEKAYTRALKARSKVRVPIAATAGAAGALGAGALTRYLLNHNHQHELYPLSH